MKVLRTPLELQCWRRGREGQSIGFVPTMGALHQGHLSLVEKSLAQNQITVVSIFLNPTQFNNSDDLQSYPKSFEQDMELLEAHGVDVLFAPGNQDMYPDLNKYQVTENSFSHKFCGAHRPGHFNGVLTVVLKLFQLVQPQQAYFGEKDFQQLQLIKNMVEAFFIPVRVTAVPTVRETDGLAMSSRNIKLNSDQRQLASQFHQVLKRESSSKIAEQQLEQLGFVVDYVEDFDNRRLAAVNLGDVRLIDNVCI